MLRHLQALRADSDLMRRVAITLGATAAVMVTITAHTMAFQDEVQMQRDRANVNEENAKLAEHYASLVAACMNGEQWIFVDPHTGADIGVFCDVEVLGRIGR